MKREDLPAYFRQCAEAMRLGHWHVKVDSGAPGDSSVASVHRWGSRFGATIRVTDAHLADDPDDLRDTMAHECIHMHFAHADALVEGKLSPADHAAWRMAVEYAVDALASVVSPLLPMPPDSEPTP